MDPSFHPSEDDKSAAPASASGSASRASSGSSATSAAAAAATGNGAELAQIRVQEVGSPAEKHPLTISTHADDTLSPPGRSPSLSSRGSKGKSVGTPRTSFVAARRLSRQNSLRGTKLMESWPYV